MTYPTVSMETYIKILDSKYSNMEQSLHDRSFMSSFVYLKL